MRRAWMCIFLPYLFLIASLICWTFVGIGCTTSSAFLARLHFMKASLMNFTSALEDLNISENKPDLPDSYLIGLWGYCKVNRDDMKCSPPSLMFWFDFPAALGLSSRWAERIFPDPAHMLLSVYQNTSKYMAIGYIAVVGTTFSTVVIGSISLLSHQGSTIAWLFIIASTIVSITFSVISTALYSILVSALNSVFTTSGIQASQGYPILVAAWFAVAFTIFPIFICLVKIF